MDNGLKRIAHGIEQQIDINDDTPETKIFKIIMEIRRLHDNIKWDIQDELSDGLRDHYAVTARESIEDFPHRDVYFRNRDNILMVYSVILDDTFPLLLYPRELLKKLGMQKNIELNSVPESYANLESIQIDETNKEQVEIKKYIGYFINI